MTNMYGTIERKANVICTTQESIIWDFTGSITILELLSNICQEWGFKINDYDRCVANKTINSKQYITGMSVT